MNADYRNPLRILLHLSICLIALCALALPLQARMDTDAGSFKRAFTWKFDGCEYRLEAEIPWQTYHFYQEKPRVFHNYAVYTYENRALSFLPGFVRQLECLAESAGLDRAQTLRFVIAFVQQLEYRNDRGEYPKWPVETIAERGGDCEDTSILLAAMLRLMGYDALLINPPGHMAVAVACEGCDGTAYRQGSRTYYYVETTAAGFAIGEVPADYQAVGAKVMSLEARPVDLWVLRAFVPRTNFDGQMVYYVSEDACTRIAASQRGEVYLARATLRRVVMDGKVSTSRSIRLR